MAPIISLGVAAGSTVLRTVATPVVAAGLSVVADCAIGVASGIVSFFFTRAVVKKVAERKAKKAAEGEQA